MIKIVVYLILSFYLEGIISTTTNMSTNFFNPLFTISALVLIYRFFEKREKNYFLLAFIIGLLYGIYYTDTFILNMVIFFLSAIFIKFINIYLAHNLLSDIVKVILTIIFYRISTFLILFIIGYLNFDYNLLFKSIYSSLLLNIIFILISYLYFRKKEF
ncbi:MAG: rod shape-determining protein MreD [Bacilli bacterium]|nr:rod shape-determining protein MreD [Bacilli bacterium]MDD4733812.1 rod shape-determining protein MreD [Bacilli bacterium]